MSITIEGYTPTIYMAGPVQHVEDGGHGWREELQESDLDAQWNNPLDKYDLSIDDVQWVKDESKVPEDPASDVEYVTSREIVQGDKNLIQKSDGVLIHLPESVPMWGTPMEMMYAYDRNIPIAASHGDFEVSPWLIDHADFRTMDMRDAAEYLIDETKKYD
jgi:nucleoside 2-deoxyribosyltransferase